MMRALRFGWVVIVAATLSACAAKAQARTEIDLPLLDPPPPPPRVVATYPEEIEPAPLVVPATQEPTGARPPTRPARPETRPETAHQEPAPPAAERPSLTLSPAPGTEAQTEVAVRAMLTRAARDLSRVNPATLSADGRAQFETARRFLQQAEEALRGHNLVYAGTLADKAATLAAVFAR
ncbi:MAG: hypothetical protein ABI665_10030 [Vicinamibacterales bacterium]